MRLRQSRDGGFHVTERLAVQWSDRPLPDGMEVVQLLADGEGEPWALSRAREAVTGWLARVRPRSVASYVLRLDRRTGWCIEARIPGELRCLARLRNGAIAAAGRRLLHVQGGARRWHERVGPPAACRLWGTSTACLYALGERKGQSTVLHHYDGESWRAVDLEPRGIFGHFVDGACDDRGGSWIVGTYQTHSCIARGTGLDWERHGCESFYLYQAHVDRDGCAFVAGGDGVWRLDEGQWRRVIEAGRPSGLPGALSTVEGAPWRVDVSMASLLGDKLPADLCVFMGGPWVDLGAPE